MTEIEYFVHTEVFWLVPKESAILKKSDGQIIELKIGTIFKYKSRKAVCKITGFTSKDSDARGPIGITYLPWRGTEWATETWTLKGNPRHIIAFPVGMPHYGEQIEWDSFELSSI